MLQQCADDGLNQYLSVEDWKENELVEVDATGAGCIMYDMEVFRKIPPPWFEFKRQQETGAPVGEDIGMCRKLKAAGYKIFVDTSIPSVHMTTMGVNRQTSLLYKAMKAAQYKKSMALGDINTIFEKE